MCYASLTQTKLAESLEEKVADQHRNVAVIAFQNTRLSVSSQFQHRHDANQQFFARRPPALSHLNESMTLHTGIASPSLTWIVFSDLYTCTLDSGMMFILLLADGRDECIGLAVCNTAMDLNIVSGEGKSVNLSAHPCCPLLVSTDA